MDCVRYNRGATIIDLGFYNENLLSDRRQNDCSTSGRCRFDTLLDVGKMSFRHRIFITTFMSLPRLYRTSEYIHRLIKLSLGCTDCDVPFNHGLYTLYHTLDLVQCNGQIINTFLTVSVTGWLPNPVT